MKQEHVTEVLTDLPHSLGDGKVVTACEAAKIVYDFLTKLIDRSGWFERQILRTVRGFVSTYRERHCGFFPPRSR